MNGPTHYRTAELYANHARDALTRGDFDHADSAAAIAAAHAQLAALAFNVANLLGTGEGGSQDPNVREANARMRDTWRDVVDNTVDAFVDVPPHVERVTLSS